MRPLSPRPAVTFYLPLRNPPSPRVGPRRGLCKQGGGDTTPGQVPATALLSEKPWEFPAPLPTACPSPSQGILSQLAPGRGRGTRTTGACGWATPCYGTVGVSHQGVPPWRWGQCPVPHRHSHTLSGPCSLQGLGKTLSNQGSGQICLRPRSQNRGSYLLANPSSRSPKSPLHVSSWLGSHSSYITSIHLTVRQMGPLELAEVMSSGWRQRLPSEVTQGTCFHRRAWAPWLWAWDWLRGPSLSIAPDHCGCCPRECVARVPMWHIPKHLCLWEFLLEWRLICVCLSICLPACLLHACVPACLDILPVCQFLSVCLLVYLLTCLSACVFVFLWKLSVCLSVICLCAWACCLGA
ncbi:uncharacterized protein LOC125620448 [Marmota marmota marmota]|uniref:uncharacterized protein LOC125620448 n=1 Tax=Marmota marmota marmota TaxID=9994 RepID=UPI002092D6A0|nr:uncharacterized protein LOC125620448 [Marmota marmota marmota]XP_048671854.1 uncharacterized protein LOC125620448 [Marmota marmota marmota]XP_048671855.1 uncharacterized protein LOC125620448 [Marmota marmota marmota]